MTMAANKTNAPPSKAEVVKKLEVALSSLYLLAIKTHGFHWNVEGPLFIELHKMFETQYTQLFETADVFAERMRALDAKAPTSAAKFATLTRVKEEPKASLPAMEMVQKLVDDYAVLMQDLQAGADAADEADDIATEDLFVATLRETGKTAWMLKAMLEK
jgi:starvation-inducible DNA-binding protein